MILKFSEDITNHDFAHGNDLLVKIKYVCIPGGGSNISAFFKFNIIIGVGKK